MKQMSLAESGFARTSKVTRKQVFLGEMERVVPWNRLMARIKPHYPVAGNGTQPDPLASMLRIHLMRSTTSPIRAMPGTVIGGGSDGV